MKKSVVAVFTVLCVSLCVLKANAQNGNVTNIIINNYPSQQQQSSSYGAMCSQRGGFCTNGVYIMSTRRMFYSPSRSRLKSSRSQRLGLNI